MVSFGAAGGNKKACHSERRRRQAPQWRNRRRPTEGPTPLYWETAIPRYARNDNRLLPQ